jgi:predicted SAM-dependent methyltransferase
MTTKEQLKRVAPLVGVVRSLRSLRVGARHALQDAPLFQRRSRRGKRIDTYLRTHPMRKLQLGTGDNVRPGWLNTDMVDHGRQHEIVYLDARKPFPLPDGSFDLVFSEHMIEHLSYAEGLRCLRECHRILRPGGRVRLATPSLSRIAQLYEDNLTDLQRRYIRWSTDSFVDHSDGYEPGFVLNNFVRSWGHEFIYDERTLRRALQSVGFVDIEEQRVGESGEPGLAGLERHLPDQAEFNEYETFVLEARRP